MAFDCDIIGYGHTSCFLWEWQVKLHKVGLIFVLNYIVDLSILY